MIYLWSTDLTRKQTALTMKNNNYNLVCRVFRRLEDVCSIEIERNPVIPFGGTGCLVKCDERKFNHKAKVSTITGYNRFVLHVSREPSGDYYSERCVEN